MGGHCASAIHPTARKPHTCVACCARIPIGETYVQQSGHWDGSAFRNRYHPECWDELIAMQLGEDEFEPGMLDPPARLTGAAKSEATGAATPMASV